MAKKNNISDREMIRTFNCGVGFCVISNQKNILKIKKIFSQFMPYEIGYIQKTKAEFIQFSVYLGKRLKSFNLILFSRNTNFPIRISLVISNNKKAYGRKRYKIPYIFVDTKIRNYENKILFHLKKHKISFICLAGFMKIIPEKLISYYRNKIINIHPSLLPKFKGLNTFSRMLKENEKI